MTTRTCKTCGRPLPTCAVNCENCGPGKKPPARPQGAETTRDGVLAILRRGPRRASVLVAELGEKQRTVENALTTLRRAGAVRAERCVWYCVEGGERA